MTLAANGAAASVSIEKEAISKWLSLLEEWNRVKVSYTWNKILRKASDQTCSFKNDQTICNFF